MLDQTIGIPIMDVSSFSGFNKITEVDEQRALLEQKQEKSLSSQCQDGFFSWNSSDASENPQSITYHPLVSGPIPLIVPKNKLSMNTPSMRTQHAVSRYVNMFSAPEIASTQPNLNINREHSERSKVKFSKTVSVAVVPVS